jgi:hypothetical protein
LTVDYFSIRKNLNVRIKKVALSDLFCNLFSI